MKRLLKELSSTLYQYILNSDKREYYRLYDKYRKNERYKLVEDVRFLDYIFTVPDPVSFIFQYKEIFVDKIYIFNTDRKQPVIYDCGSNVGTSIVYFRKLYKNAHIVGFEADKNIANICRSNLKNNNAENVEIIDKAVWINNDNIEFNEHGADGGSIHGSGNKKIVESIRLKEYLDNEPYIDFLKIDIEGAEYEVLLDCKDSLNNIENIFIEYHSWVNDSQKLSSILNILETNGFRYYLESLTKKDSPFLSKTTKSTMDLQVNIFGYRI